MWTLDCALPIIRSIAPIAKKCGFGVALYGSVLTSGKSNSDLDLVFIVEEPDIRDVKRCLGGIATLPDVRTVGPVRALGDEDRVLIWLRDGKRIEARFLRWFFEGRSLS